MSAQTGAAPQARVRMWEFLNAQDGATSAGLSGRSSIASEAGRRCVAVLHAPTARSWSALCSARC